MDIFYIKSRRGQGSHSDKIRVEDLMVKLDSSRESKDGLIRAKTLVGGYADRYPVSSIVYITREQIISMIINARENINSTSLMLEEFINARETKEDMVKRIIESEDSISNKMRNLFTVIDSESVSDTVESSLKKICLSTEDNFSLGPKEAFNENSSFVAIAPRPNRRAAVIGGNSYIDQGFTTSVASSFNGAREVIVEEALNRSRGIEGEIGLAGIQGSTRIDLGDLSEGTEEAENEQF